MAGGGSSVVFVVMDTVRKDHLSVYGYERATTPELKRVAEDATVFDQAITPAPWTLPVHASLFTGQYPSEHGASQENPYLDGALPIAEVLQNSGYATACYSSNAWITPYTGLTNGFGEQDNFFEIIPSDLLAGPLAKTWQTLNDFESLRIVANRLVELGNQAHEMLAGGKQADSKTPQVIDRTIEFINRVESPYFAFINLMDAHLPYYPPTEYLDEFASGVDPSTVCQNAKEYNAGARSIPDDEWATIRDLYDAEIRHIDAELGRLFSWLKERPEWEELLVVVCADHGELHGEHGLFGHEFSLYDPVVNVPLIVKHPSLDAGIRDEQVELLDLYHTILDHTAVSTNDNVVPLNPQRSLLSTEHREFPGSEFAFIEYDRPIVELQQLESKARSAGIDLDEDSRFYSRMRAVRRRDAKYIRNERIPDEFYRLIDDPQESTNQYSTGDPAEQELVAALTEFEARVNSHWGEPPDDDDVLDDMDAVARDRLRDLGYLE